MAKVHRALKIASGLSIYMTTCKIVFWSVVITNAFYGCKCVCLDDVWFSLLENLPVCMLRREFNAFIRELLMHDLLGTTVRFDLYDDVNNMVCTLTKNTYATIYISAFRSVG